MSPLPNYDRNQRGSNLSARIENRVQHLRGFWQRVTEGLAVEQLWKQFRADARASYDLYSREVDWATVGRESKAKKAFRIGRALFWAMLMKLTPPRRVFLLIALLLLVFLGIKLQLGGSSIDAESFHFLGGLALFALLGLELADRVIMKRDLEIARDIQRWLMPEAPPQVPGVDIAFATRPANTVAGDYYDAFLRPVGSEGTGPPPASRLLLVVADVAGKSVPAALLMATFQASLRTLAWASCWSTLPDLVAGLNGYACAHSLGGSRFTTAFLAELDPSSRALTYVCAGHNPAILRRASGTLERLEVGGLPLGIRPGTPYNSATVTLEPGDVLVIFTDGVVEAENNQEEEYGDTRLLALLAANRRGSAADILKAVMGSVDTFVGDARQHDDLTCLVARVV